MKMKTNMRCQFLLVLCVVGLKADDDYGNKLTKLWSYTGTANSDGSAVVNVTSASILIQPTSYSNEPNRQSREAKLPFVYKNYAFKPRAIPLRRDQETEGNVYYSQDDVNKYKSEVLFPGNYLPIAKEKSQVDDQFQPKEIPLLREDEFQKRSLDEDIDEEPIIEKPEGFLEAIASRRSISDYFGVEEDDDDYQTEDEDENEGEVEEKGHKGHKGHGSHAIKYKRKAIKKGTKKLTKYMLPLLMAYKLKYFALVPLLIGGLVLLVGATGLAGFFFALFAAVMGLQKGGY